MIGQLASTAEEITDNVLLLGSLLQVGKCQRNLVCPSSPHLGVPTITILVLAFAFFVCVVRNSQCLCAVYFFHLWRSECFPLPLNIHLYECQCCVMFCVTVLSLTFPISLFLNYEWYHPAHKCFSKFIFGFLRVSSCQGVAGSEGMNPLGVFSPCCYKYPVYRPCPFFSGELLFCVFHGCARCPV